jgi:hypothetical protein
MNEAKVMGAERGLPSKHGRFRPMQVLPPSDPISPKDSAPFLGREGGRGGKGFSTLLRGSAFLVHPVCYSPPLGRARSSRTSVAFTVLRAGDSSR